MWFQMTKAKANSKLEKAFQNRNFEGAIKAFKTLIESDSDDHELYNNLGIALLESGDYQKSIFYFNKGVQRFDLCVLWNNLGRALLKQSKHDEAQDAFNHARQLDSTDPQPWYNLTVSLRDQGRTEESFNDLLDFIQEFPDHANGLNDLGCHLLEQGKVDKAIGYLEHATITNPNYSPARLNLIQAFCECRRFPESTPHLEVIAQSGVEVKVNADEENVSIVMNGQQFFKGKIST